MTIIRFQCCRSFYNRHRQLLTGEIMTKLDERLVKQAPKDLQEIFEKNKAETNEEAKNSRYLFPETPTLTIM